MRTPTLHDVAHQAGVSSTTVSRVLNNRGYISQTTRDKVYAAMEELNYTPNAVARSLRDSRSHTVGIIFPTVAHPFYGHMAQVLEQQFAAHGYRVLICNSDGNEETEMRHMQMLIANQVDGIVTGAHSNAVSSAPRLRAPLVTIDRQFPGTHPNVRAANTTAAREATEGLIDRGAKYVVHLTSSQRIYSTRSVGYSEALAGRGLPAHIARVKRGIEWQEDRGQVAKVLDERLQQDRIDAIFTSNDTLAFCALEWAMSRGLSIPEDIQIMGFDGARATRNLLPDLSTVIQPFDEMARTAVGLIIDAVEGRMGEDVLTPFIEQPSLGSPENAIELEAEIFWGGTTRQLG